MLQDSTLGADFIALFADPLRPALGTVFSVAPLLSLFFWWFFAMFLFCVYLRVPLLTCISCITLALHYASACVLLFVLIYLFYYFALYL